MKITHGYRKHTKQLRLHKHSYRADARVFDCRGAGSYYRRTQVLNGELENTFRRWYPGFRPHCEEQPAAMAA